MKYTIIGDIHGKWELVEDALARDGKKIFVGDFMDSFTRTPRDMEKCLELVINACKQGDTECIYGNHELSYIQPDIHRCSGYNVINEAIILPFKSDINKYFKSHLWVTNEILVTHAGLSNRLINPTSNYPRTYGHESDEIAKGLTELKDRIGMARGGLYPCGGIYWCDFRYEFEPIKGIMQVFGHTAGKTVIQKGETIETTGLGFCIDCLDYDTTFFELEI